MFGRIAARPLAEKQMLCEKVGANSGQTRSTKDVTVRFSPAHSSPLLGCLGFQPEWNRSDDRICRLLLKSELDGSSLMVSARGHSRAVALVQSSTANSSTSAALAMTS